MPASGAVADGYDAGTSDVIAGQYWQAASHQQHGRIHEQFVAQPFELAVLGDTSELHEHAHARYPKLMKSHVAIVRRVKCELFANVACFDAYVLIFQVENIHVDQEKREEEKEESKYGY